MKFSGKNRGFTLVELVMTMVIIGIMGAVAAPRFLDNNTFKSRGFADQVKASLSYAQKVAVAQHRFVCVAFTSTSVTLTLGATSACGTTMQSPTSSGGYVINAPSGISFSATPSNFNFDSLGKPSFSTQQSITVSGYNTAILIEAETGYVH